MADTVLAGSLASVIQLADNPPERLPPNGERSEVGEYAPLVMYIARVPGSRDVILTTLKPKERVVTAQDVQSCLYYVHVDSDKDMDLIRGNDTQDESTGIANATNISNRGSVRRKPVLPHRASVSTAVFVPVNGDAVLAPPPPYMLKAPTKITRKPVHENTPPTSSEQTHPYTTPALPARPSGPRPLQDTRHRPIDPAALAEIPNRQNIDVRRWSEQPSVPPRLPLRPYEQKERDLEEAYAVNSALYPSTGADTEQLSATDTVGWNDDTAHSQASDFSLRLIRRYDNSQCNIGRIIRANGVHDRQDIDLISPGYRRLAQRAQTNASLPAGASQRVNQEDDLSQEEETAYRCSLHTMFSPLRAELGAHSPTIGSRSRIGLESRRSLFGSNDLERSQTNPAASHQSKSSSGRGFLFQSPWGGTCDFVTGVAGRSLKCRHTRPEYRNLDSIPVSELRFNLPTSKAFGSPAPKSLPLGATREKRSSYFPHRRQRSSVDSGRDGSAGWAENGQVEGAGGFDARLDLSLGQEHAGGGFGGRQAKLGKLVVEPEGLQMLDLVVAANMALWWRVYDRTV